MSKIVENEIQVKWEQILDLFRKNYDIKAKRFKLKLGAENG